MRQCSKCKITYDESNFYKDRTHKDGLSSVCKDCRREYNILYRQRRLKLGLCYDCGKPRPEGTEPIYPIAINYKGFTNQK